MIYILLIAGVIFLDRIVKDLVHWNMLPGESFQVIGDFFHITYVRNTGAAFSIFQGQQQLLIILPALFICICIVIFWRKKSGRLLSWAISLICAGGAGNMYDRLAHGYVIDMFDFGSFPVFNVADIAVCTGCGLLVLYVLLKDDGEKKNGKN